MSLRLVPLDLNRANALVSEWHRHHKPVRQAKYCIGVCDGYRLCGAAIVGRPVARLLDDGMSLEVNRCVTDGTPNACSMLYGAAARAAKALGYTRVFTYIRVDEPGISLKASGWVCDVSRVRRRSWDMPGRKRIDKTELIERQRWKWESGDGQRIEPKPMMLNGVKDLFV